MWTNIVVFLLSSAGLLGILYAGLLFVALVLQICRVRQTLFTELNREPTREEAAKRLREILAKRSKTAS